MAASSYKDIPKDTSTYPSICLNVLTHSKRTVSRKTPSPFAQLPERPENYINKCDSRILFYKTALQSLAHCSLMFNGRVLYPSHQYSCILNTQKKLPQLVLPQNFQVRSPKMPLDEYLFKQDTPFLRLRLS